MFTFTKHFTLTSVRASQQTCDQQCSSCHCPHFAEPGQGVIYPEASAAKGCVQDCGQGIPTSGTGAAEGCSQGMPALRCQGRLAQGALLLPAPTRLSTHVVGGERPVGFINISHPSTNPRRFQNAVWWCPLLDISGSTGLLLLKEWWVLDLFIATQKSVEGLLCAEQSSRNDRGGGENSKSPYLPQRYIKWGRGDWI